MNIIAVCGLAIVAAAAVTVIKKLSPELSSFAVAAAGILIFAYIAESLLPFISFVKDAAAESGAESCFLIMIKALAISLCCRMSADICRDCGESALANHVELAGKAAIVLISLPIIKQLFEIAWDMMK